MNKNLKKMKRYRFLANVFYPIAALLLCLMLIANTLLWSNSDMVSQFLNQPTSKKVNTTGEEVDSQYYKSNYTKLKQVQKDEKSYAQDVQTEGAVLLQNNCLPLAEGSSVTLLGYSCTAANFLVGGGGSGSIDTSNTPSLKDVFELAGFQINETMWEFYTSGDGKSSYNASGITEPAQDKYGSEQIASFAEYNDAAIVVISRKGSEASDITAGLLNLTAEEDALITMAKKNFKNVVILLNTMNAVSLGKYEGDPQISILWVGAGGQQGLRAIPEILNGQRNPSGHLTDTYAYDAYSAPAMVNFGNYQMTGDLGAYVNYAEGIYVGYKYYETRYADVVTGRENVGEYDYASTVQYPFGYGLSYAGFSYSNFSVTDKGDTLEFTVRVTNTSSNPDLWAKDAVQIYMQSPYTDYDITNGIEKAAVQLVGFVKTNEIEPGHYEDVTITVDKSCMRTYDSKGAKTWIVDAGDYYFAVGADSHEALNNILAAQGYTTANGMTADGDAAFAWKLNQAALDTTTYSTGADGSAITNEFDDASYSYFDDTYTYLSRNNWTGTWPTLLGDGALEPNAKIKKAMQVLTVADDPNAVMPTTGAGNDIVIVSMMGKDYNDSDWDKLLDNLTVDEMSNIITTAGYGNAAMASVSKPSLIDKDGPAGISSTLIGGAGCFGFPTENLLASTWNVDLATKMGDFIGEDSLYSGVTGWYAPSMNIHRTAYSGRNFEYYSEDSYISGVFGTAVTKAASARGVYCYIKHFALNDQETNRQLITTWANEQAIREIYLLPFEMTVRNGNATGVMVSMNRIGCVWTGASKALCTNVLRNEWGFVGAIVTDSETGYNANKDVRLALNAGVDMFLCPTAGIWTIDTTNATNVVMMRNACHNILYMVANSNAMNGLDANIKVVTLTPAWHYWLIAADIALALIFGFAVIFCSIKWAKYAKKVKKEGK